MHSRMYANIENSCCIGEPAYAYLRPYDAIAICAGCGKELGSIGHDLVRFEHKMTEMRMVRMAANFRECDHVSVASVGIDQEWWRFPAEEFTLDCAGVIEFHGVDFRDDAFAYLEDIVGNGKGAVQSLYLFEM